MQFLPGTWARFASDGKGDGKPDVQNIFDAALAAARYLCSGGLNLRDPTQTIAAILRYNNSMPYVENVLAWAAAYATGAVPVDLPPITGPIPPIADPHLDGGAPEGSGPGLPVNAISPPAADLVALLPVPSGGIDSANEVNPGALATGQYPGESPSCVVTCGGGESVMAPKAVTAPLAAPASGASALRQKPVSAAFAPSTLRAQTGGTRLLSPAPSGQPSSAGQPAVVNGSVLRQPLSGATQPLRGVQAVGSLTGHSAQPLHAGSPKRR
ncbi:MAG: lytic murein transglycosylase [Mycolicibacterium sp.]|nr:lytic murein transglycosylase [Mycolicibacterium sp.]